jgi:flavin reductase (DIM6/NTAB) family NADH-FMN oxidoreductase RutF
VAGVTDPQNALADLLGDTDGPMWILTVSTGEERSGCLIGFATQVSIDPVRFLACVSKVNHTFDLAMRSEHVAVHVAPSGDDDGLARLFGEETGDEVDKFARCAWHEGPHGVPLLDDCPDWFAGEVLERRPLGDHVGFLLAPVAAACAGRSPMPINEIVDIDAGHDA